MGLYNFKERFVKPIRAGDKTHTIRDVRDHPDVPGKIMHLYTGLRTKKAKLIFRAPCTVRQDIEIYFFEKFCVRHYVVAVDGYILARDEREQLARRDGFSGFHDMMIFWTGRLPFKGHILHWNYAKRKYGAKKSRKRSD